MIRQYTIALILFVLIPFFALAEGSKQIWIPPHQTALFLCNDFANKCNGPPGWNGDRSQFAVYGCTEPDRLYFVSNAANEAVYLGFNGNIENGYKIVFRIKDMAGTIVYGQRDLPASGYGFISTIAQAQVGPTQLFGAGGYNALSFHPPAPATYYIEFNRVTNSGGASTGSFNLDLIDITVADTVASVAKPGRLYCKSWQFSENGGDNCSATTYIYSNDSIITSCTFDDMSGGTWIQFCNQNGCGTSGNFVIDRMSVNTQVLLPQYKIFVNPPDPVLFPPATTLGQIVPPAPWGERFCNNGNIIFHVTVDKPGNAEIYLNFGPPYVQRTLSQAVVAGENLIVWDGLDGTLPVGIPVPNNTNITFTISYINGLTNLPFYDVEQNQNGFVIALVSPPGSTPLVYWDDTGVGGGFNLTGCLSPPGCHTWMGSGQGFGNLKTINTWWYNVSTTTVPATITEWRGPQTLVFNQVPPQSYCAGSNGLIFSVVADPNTTEYHFSYTGTGATIVQINPTNSFVTVSFATNATSGSLQVYGTNTNCPGNGPTTSLPITIKPYPAVNPPFTKSICSGTFTSIPLSSTPPGSLFTWTSPPPTCTPNIVACPPGMINSLVINDMLGVTDLNPGTVTYHVTPILNMCQGTAQDITVTVNPLPDISNVVLNLSVCNGGTTNIALTSSIPATSFSWTATPSSPTLSGYTSSSGAIITDMLFNSGSTVETVTYQVTPSVNGCTGTPKNFVVTVYPVAQLSNSPPSQSQCDNLATNITLTSNVAGARFTWTCTPTSPSITGWSDNSVPATLLNQVLDNTGFNIEGVTYHITPDIQGCPGTMQDFSVTVFPTPDLSNSPLSKSQCDNVATNVALTSNVSGTLFTWTCTPSSGNITGWANNVVGTTTLNQTLDNTGFNIEWVTYHVTPTANGCNGAVTDYVVTVYPTPNLSNAPLSKSQCDNVATNVTLTSNAAGTLFTWTCTPSSGNITGWANNAIPTVTLNQTLDNTGNNIEWVTYQVTPAANGCNGPVTNYVVTVYPTPIVTNLPLSKTQCDNQNTNILLTSNVAGTLFTWTCTPSSGNITGWANNAIPAGTISQVLDNTGFNIEGVTYEVTPTANGCTGIPVNYVVTVFPTPNLSNAPASKSQCDNLATNITLTSNVAGTLFTWTCTPSSGNITGWANNAVPTVTLNQTLDNTGNNIEWVTYQVTPAANGCNGPVTNYVVTVYPTPNLSNMPPSMQLCNNSFTNLTLTSNAAGALFTWTCTPSSANITGWSNNAVPTILLNQFLTNSGLNTEWVTYHVTPTANGCIGPVTDYTVTVVQTPDVFFSPPAQTICSQQTSNIQVLSSVLGTTFTWTVTPSSPNLSGQAPGSGNLIAQTVTNSGNTIEWVTYQVTPTAFGCPPGPSQNIILTVNPRPVVNNAVTSFQVCSAAATNITLTSTVPGSTFAWTASGSSPNVTGYSNGAGPTIMQLLTNSGFNIEGVTYQVTPTANGCPGNATPFVVTVFPVANVIFTPNGQTFCSGNMTSIGLSSGVAGTSYAWTASGSGLSLSGYSPGSGNFIQQTLFNSGPYPQWATYQVAPTANGCPGTSNSVIVTVNPLPGVTVTPCFDPVVSVNSQPIPLRGNVPIGGTWSGPGVNAGVFFPAFAGPGTHVISYSYTNTWGCPAGANVSISVVILGPFTCGNTLTDVRDNKAYPTVLIGGQCWFATNLNYGATIPSTQMQLDNCVFEKYCFGDNPANCATTGGMYQWDELMKYRVNNGAQGFCPPEWHIPTEADWNVLFAYYISNGFAGSPLKYTGYSGFNALLSGTRFNNVQWDFSNFAILYWSSTFHTARKAWAHGMNSFNPSVSFYPSHRNNAFPVRCIKD